MRLCRLRIDNVRNLGGVELRPGASVNFILGPNASGKSSLLEAMYLLSCGKSFRTHRLRHVLNQGTDRLTVVGEVNRDDGSRQTLGVEYSQDTGRLSMKAGGERLAKVAELAACLPVVAVHQESHRVFTEGPVYRRRALDWGLFHVEPRFLPVWQRYHRALKQRNRELQGSSGPSGAWDRELVAGAEEIDRLRRAQLDRLLPAFRDCSSLLRVEGAIRASYRRGWAGETDYATVLAEAATGDRAAGHTRYGPHRADIRFTLDGVPVREALSRGQLKVLVYALALGQAATHQASSGRRCLLLMDDLSAELDDGHIGALLTHIQSLGLQVFVTSSEDRISAHLSGEQKRFHVEHGTLTEML